MRSHFDIKISSQHVVFKISLNDRDHCDKLRFVSEQAWEREYYLV